MFLVILSFGNDRSSSSSDLTLRCRKECRRPGKVSALNLCRLYLTYCSGVAVILLQLILDCFCGLIQKKISCWWEGHRFH